MLRRLTLLLALAAPLFAAGATMPSAHAAPVQPGQRLTAGTSATVEKAQYRYDRRQYHRRRRYYRRYYRR